MKNILDIADKFDAFFIDMYGVLYDGSGFYDGALDVLGRLKAAGKTIIILSNTTIVSNICQEWYGQKGLLRFEHYDHFISSGEAFRHYIMDSDFRNYIQIFNKNNDLFDSGLLEEVHDIKESDFVYVGSINSSDVVYDASKMVKKSGESISMDCIFDCGLDEIYGMDDIFSQLQLCLFYKKPLFVVNPDLFAIVNGRTILCQGAIGRYYEKMGGVVEYFGKPHQNIYNFASDFVKNCHKIAMIGDTPWTDILGGNMFGIKTILVKTGIVSKFIENDFVTESIQDISSKMTGGCVDKSLFVPTYIIDFFA